MGRTEMQDAVPMTVGQELFAFGNSLDDEIQALQEAEKSLYAVNMGATATDRSRLRHDSRDLGSAGIRSLFRRVEKLGNQALENFK